MPELYVGLDDSNHHEDDRIKGEIIVAAFSFHRGDSKVKKFKNRRDYGFADGWLRVPGTDYMFTLLTGKKEDRRGSENLIKAAPTLIDAYLDDHSGLKLDSLKVYLDGRLSADGKNTLKSKLSRRSPEVIVSNFIKKRKDVNGNIVKGPRCPTVVYVADSLAHRLFQGSTEECLKHDRFVSYE